MKKVILAAILLVAMGALTACSDDAELRVFIWGEFHNPIIGEMFYEETGIRVFFDFYATNQEMYSILVHQNADFDVLFPSDYMIERLILENRLAPLNWDNIPNARYLHHYFDHLAFDPQGRYSVPYKWGLFGILYNQAMVPDMQESWGMLFDENIAPQFADRIYMYASARDSLGSALRWLGYSHNTTSLSELHAARDLLIRQGDWIRGYQGDLIRDAMIGGNAALAQIFSGCAFWTMTQNPDLNFVIPVEGTQFFIDAMVIPATSTRQTYAEKFINFMMRPDIAYLNTTWTMYSTTNAATLEMLPREWRESQVFWPTDEIVARGYSFRDLGEFRQEYYDTFNIVLIMVG